MFVNNFNLFVKIEFARDCQNSTPCRIGLLSSLKMMGGSYGTNKLVLPLVPAISTNTEPNL